MDLKDIKAIIDLMKKNSISEFELERQDFKIRLKRGGAGAPQIGSYDEVQTGYVSGGTVATVVPMPLPAPGGPAAGATDTEIKAPMIGTFYRAPSPEAGNYVEVGTEVNPDTVVCIIEAMKVFNEIPAEVRGKIAAVLCEEGEAVEFDKPLFKVDTSA